MSGLIVLDYGGGNLKSVTNILDKLGYTYNLTAKKEDILEADKIILPGQGHFGQFMKSLNSKGLTEALTHKINSGTPFLGICLGIQVLFEESEEAPGIKGLCIFPGKVVKFTEGKVPQIGWNELKITTNNTVLTNDYVYFVNSYHVVPENKEIISAYSDYYMGFVASIEYKNIFAFQFHPEKSGEVGFEFFRRWIEKN
ncbi:MAG: imidazole glycerol phosphate synthase, glutamine amidotransferase subunit [Candidatus Melainabacteria bacterium GWA2_34_9]|nr:MAG: imidazole glycerol phosphate synthase, glutamine amidotransferase subunit [Candidatus Melainabacteria bacterium GWA2_34_9]